MKLLRSELLSQVPGIVHGFSSRSEDLPDQGNVSLTQGDPARALHNRRLFCADLGIQPDQLTFSRQEHGITIRPVNLEDRGAGALDPSTALPAADGLLTGVANLPMTIMVADCACLLICDRGGQVVGAFHAGWRGVYEDMPGRAVREFKRMFNISAEDLLVWISPMICGDCFEVGPDVGELFLAKWGAHQSHPKPNRVNLPELIEFQLLRNGVRAGHIEKACRCTFEDPSLFSHRRGDVPNGRLMGVIAKK